MLFKTQKKNKFIHFELIIYDIKNVINNSYFNLYL